MAGLLGHRGIDQPHEAEILGHPAVHQCVSQCFTSLKGLKPA